MKPPSASSVSLCMIVRNEAHNLAECLTPVAPLVDEIVIVDTGSHDGTREIASRFTPHVYDFAWCDDFAAARNESLRQAHGDWILWLDADDRVRVPNVARLTKLLRSLDRRPQVFHMQSISIVPGESGGICEASQPRLFWRHPELRWTGRVHEQLAPDPISLGLAWTKTDIEIEHTGYQDTATCFRKMQRKLRLLRMDYATNPDDCSTLFHLGTTAIEAGDAAAGRKHLSRLAAIAPPQAGYLSRVLGSLAELSLAEGQPAEALLLIQRGRQTAPADEHLCYLQAHCHYQLGEANLAIPLLQALIAAPQAWQFQMGQPGQIRERLAPRLLAEILASQGAIGAAQELLSRVVSTYPRDAHAWYVQGLTCIVTQQSEKFEAVITRLGEFAAGRIQATLLRAIWHLRLGPLEAAGRLLDETIVAAPGLAFARQLRVEWLSRSGASVAAQIRAVRDVLRIQPWNREAQRWLQQLEGMQVQTALPAVIPVGMAEDGMADCGVTNRGLAGGFAMPAIPE